LYLECIQLLENAESRSSYLWRSLFEIFELQYQR